MCPLKKNKERVNGYRMKQTQSLTTPKNKQGAYLPASSTIEGALVIPLFLYAAIAVIYVLQIVAIKQRVQMALYNDVKKIAGYVYAYKKGTKDQDSHKIVSSTMAWAVLIEELGTSYAKQNYILGGSAGFVMALSDICDENSVVDLKVTYTVKNPFDIFGIGKVSITQRSITDAWLGEDYNKSQNSDSSNKDKEFVYVTEQGEVYHKNKYCTYLTRVIQSKNIGEINSITNSNGEKYYPCERCGNKQIKSDQIYVTQYGNRYHTDINCSQLSRTILRIPVSEVGDRTMCVKCGEKNE